MYKGKREPVQEDVGGEERIWNIVSGVKRAEPCGHMEVLRTKPPRMVHICHDSLLFNLAFSSSCKF